MEIEESVAGGEREKRWWTGDCDTGGDGGDLFRAFLILTPKYLPS